jgi:hypothetical protein
MKTNQKAAMTRKEALAVLHKLYDVVSWQWFLPGAHQESKALKEEVQIALRTLDIAVHGKRASCTGFGFGLCKICSLHYSTYTVLLKGDSSQYAYPCCTACLRTLSVERRLERVEHVLPGASSVVLVAPTASPSARKAVRSCSR